MAQNTNISQSEESSKDTDVWDLSSLFKTKKEWDEALDKMRSAYDEFAKYKGYLNNAETLLAALRAYEAADMLSEAVSEYASLLYYADCTDAAAQSMHGKARMALTEAGEKISFFEPEVLAIDSDKIGTWIELEDYRPYRVYLERLLRQKAHTLSEKEERLLSLQAISSAAPAAVFGALTNADMEFGSVNVNGKEMPLTQGTYSSFMENPNRAVRKEAYNKFYRVFDAHKETLAALYAGQVSQDVFITRARGYKSCLIRALYYDNVDESVYRALIETVHKNFDALHRYYALIKKALGVQELRHYDVYAPLAKHGEKNRVTYSEAVDLCTAALSPLGESYTAELRQGLLGGWVDRYERKGKRSGAFSAGSYRSNPFILLNYQDDTLRDVFTLAHEGGHSMHSLYSARANPYMQYNYSIFEAETASTLNEELLFRYLMQKTDSETQRFELLDRRAKDIAATLYRQTMFAEAELIAHEMVEKGEALSLDVLRHEYRKLLKEYFGPAMHFEDTSDLECLRIPHFYSAFYVYKYAAGMSAALAIANRITSEGAEHKKALDDYMAFLHSGGSLWPIDALLAAGVDMRKTAPVQAACDTFAAIVDELEKCL